MPVVSEGATFVTPKLGRKLSRAFKKETLGVELSIRKHKFNVPPVITTSIGGVTWSLEFIGFKFSPHATTSASFRSLAYLSPVSTSRSGTSKLQYDQLKNAEKAYC